MKRLIPKSQFKSMPWKNRLGLTNEIAIHPPESDVKKNDFEWRLSCAQVIAKNTFSNFPGYDRLLTVLSGEGLLLNDKELRPSQVIKFKGEDSIQCSLLKDEVEDLGIIFNRERYHGEMRILELDQAMTLDFEEGTHFLKALNEKMSVDWSRLEKSDFIRIEGPEQCEVEAASYPAAVMIITLRRNELLK